MDPVSLSCPKCAATWKLIKAGTGPITCPMCKAPLDGQPSADNPSLDGGRQATAAPATEAATQAPPTPAPVAEPPFAGISQLTHVAGIEDADDPGGLKADFDDQPRRRRGSHPLLKTLIILLILFILVPVAIFILLLVVCAVGLMVG
jgi:hypothetical protein